MNVVFYEMTDNINKISKELKRPLAIGLFIKNPNDLLKPTLLLTFNPLDDNRNYLFMFGKYFFIEGVEIVRTGLYKIQCSIDVLKTHENYIKSLYASITASENPDSDFVDTAMSDKETLLEYNLTDVFDARGKIYMTTVYKEVL